MSSPTSLGSSITDVLRNARVARLATVDERGRPHVVPIVFVQTEGTLYTPLDNKPKSVAPERLQRVRNILANPSVQVLVDSYTEDWSRLWYVQFRGRAELLDRGEEYHAACRLLQEKYPQYAELPLDGRPLIKIKVGRVVTWGKSLMSGAVEA